VSLVHLSQRLAQSLALAVDGGGALEKGEGVTAGTLHPERRHTLAHVAARAPPSPRQLSVCFVGFGHGLLWPP
tara:strand:- start:842 stop:1060 length:219 start_codon:yes stop_codon:yes gene_type:complete